MMASMQASGRRMLRRILLAAAFGLSQPAVAAGSGQATSGQTELITLGTGGGPLIRAQRAEPSTLLVVDGTAYLIDCGTGALRRMVEAGFAPQDVHAIFITHHHPDHDLDLANIMGSDFFSNAMGHRHGHWAIYGPPGTERMVRAAIAYLRVPFDSFAAEGISPWRLAPDFSAHDIAKSGLVYRDGKITVTAAENTHYALMPARFRSRMKSYAYRVQTPHGVIVFTGDTGPSPDVAKLAKGADVLVSEVIDEDRVVKAIGRAAARTAAERARRKIVIAHLEREHITPAAVAQLASEAGVKAVLLHHFVPGTGNGDARHDVRGVKAAFDGQVIPGRDLARYCVNAAADGTQPLSACN